MISERDDCALIVFVKNPDKGKVKTRLAKDVGDDDALKIYLQLLDRTQSVCRDVNGHVHVFFSDRIPSRTQPWSDFATALHVQHGDNLGDRMTNAFNQIFKDYRNVVIIGSDCPGLTAEIINSSFTSIESERYVIGPAMDGGYYLLGIPRSAELPFRDIKWSSEFVLSQTLEILFRTGRNLELKERLRDIDTIEDLRISGFGA